jgi:argonaute-like protein implicated in RNA metabolism and viral defense
MLQLELPHINVITKCDIADKEQIEQILDNEGALMISHNDTLASGKWKKLTETLSQVIDDFMIVSYIMLDMNDEDTITEVLYRCDEAIQYGEDIEPEEPKEGDNFENDNEY